MTDQFSNKPKTTKGTEEKGSGVPLTRLDGRFKGQGVRATRLWQDAQALARLKELYSEQVQRADKYFIDSQRLRAALEKIVGFSEPGFMHAALEIARAALGEKDK